MKPEFVIYTTSGTELAHRHYAQESTMRRALLSVEGTEFTQAIVACREDRIDEAIELLQQAKIARAARIERNLQEQIESAAWANDAQRDAERENGDRTPTQKEACNSTGEGEVK